jgi:hypothetical protein
VAYDEELAERLREVLAGVPGLREKAMFGGLAFLVGGHMAVAASGTGGLLLRVDPARTAEHLTSPGVEPFEMRGRPVDGWVRVVPEAVATDDELARWVEVGRSYAEGLPPR